MFSGLKKIMGRMLFAIFLTSVALALLCTSFSGIFHNNDSLLVSEIILSLILGILGSLVLLEILGSTFSGLLNLIAITPLGIIITIWLVG